MYRKGRQNVDEIIEEFKAKGILRGLTYRFKANDALDIIQKCRILHKRILGIEAFIITEKITQVQEYIDYSSSSYDNMDESIYYSKFHVRKNIDAGHWLEAEQFVRDRMNKGWVFEINYET
jgi:hypothetical protein